MKPPQTRFDDSWLVKLREVAAVDQRHRRAAPGERGGRDGAVDAAPDHEHVERAVTHPSQIRVAELHQATTTMTATMLAMLTMTGVAYVAQRGTW